MAERLWLVRHGATPVSTHRHKPFNTGGRPSRWSSLLQVDDSSLGYAPPLYDDLTFGPHHLDLDTQAQMRLAYARSEVFHDDGMIRSYLPALAAGDELVLWVHPTLASTLTAIWAACRLTSLGADPGRLSVVVDPRFTWEDAASETELTALIEGRLPLAAEMEALAAVRSAAAAPTPCFTPDLKPLSPGHRGWVAVSSLLAHRAPDERGLDYYESVLLDRMTEEPQKALWVIGKTFTTEPRSPLWGVRELALWSTMLEMSSQRQLLDANGPPAPPLCEITVPSEGTVHNAMVRLTPQGERARSGAEPARMLARLRWIGGCLVSDRQRLHRRGSYRDGTAGEVILSADLGGWGSDTYPHLA